MQNEMPYYLKDETFDLTELHKLGDYLENHGYSYKYDMLGHQIIVFHKDTGDRWFDVLCHSFSYGHEKGLLESYGLEIGGENPDDDFVRGWLTAQDVIDHLELIGKLAIYCPLCGGWEKKDE